MLPVATVTVIFSAPQLRVVDGVDSQTEVTADDLRGALMAGADASGIVGQFIGDDGFLLPAYGVLIDRIRNDDLATPLRGGESIEVGALAG